MRSAGPPAQGGARPSACVCCLRWQPGRSRWCWRSADRNASGRLGATVQGPRGRDRCRLGAGGRAALLRRCGSSYGAARVRACGFARAAGGPVSLSLAWYVWCARLAGQSSVVHSITSRRAWSVGGGFSDPLPAPIRPRIFRDHGRGQHLGAHRPALVIHTDTWDGSRAWRTTSPRSARTASRSTASFSRAANAATVLSAS